MANILVVDDAAFMRIMLKDTLNKLGYKVIGEGSDGIEAVSKYKELNPDVVIMDITMPNIDGIGAVKEIKKIDSNAKIIMCSAMGQKEMIKEAILAGAKDFIVKPFQSDRIKEALEKII